VLERLLRPADGADRLTIELMAEEEGVPLEVVHETLDRLVREGRVRSEAEPDGGEVLAWAGE
jgi:DNA-binding IscR family transcriptional regulator